jgi:hypothetical protein
MITSEKEKKEDGRQKRTNGTCQREREKSSPLYANRDYCFLSLCLFLQGRIQKAIPIIGPHRQVASFSLSVMPRHGQDNELVIN